MPLFKMKIDLFKRRRMANGGINAFRGISWFPGRLKNTSVNIRKESQRGLEEALAEADAAEAAAPVSEWN